MFSRKSFKAASFSLKSFYAEAAAIVDEVQFTVLSVTKKITGKTAANRALAMRQRDRFSFSSSDRHIIRRR